MNDQEVNRLLAEWMGWTLVESQRGEFTLQYAYEPGARMPWERVRPEYEEASKKQSRVVPWSEFDSGAFDYQARAYPQYCSDLNAVAEVEGRLSLDESIRYFDELRGNGPWTAIVCAPAKARAHALARVIKEMEDEA